MIFDILSGGLGGAEIIIILAALILSLLIAMSLHEYAHALAAYKAGDYSAKRAGRLSLNPRVHIDLTGFISFLIAGVGWAKPVPVNPFNYRNFKRGNFWVSISGVLTNIIVGFICSFAYYFLRDFYASANLLLFGLHWFFMFCMMNNLSLAVFNLLPIPPLDGYNLLVSFTKPNNGFMKAMRENAMILLIVFVVFGGFIIFAVREYIASAFVALWELIL